MNDALKLKIDTSDLEIPLRYYREWNVVFYTRNESFNCPILCLFGFSNAKDLEKAIDFALLKREEK